MGMIEPRSWHRRRFDARTRGRSPAEKRDELVDVPGWADTFLVDGEAPAPGSLFKQPALAETLERLAKAGLDDFYRGELARRIAAGLERAGATSLMATPSMSGIKYIEFSRSVLSEHGRRDLVYERRSGNASDRYTQIVSLTPEFKQGRIEYYAMSALGPGCVKTRTPRPIAQQLNPEGGVGDSLLRRRPVS